MSQTPKYLTAKDALELTRASYMQSLSLAVPSEVWEAIANAARLLQRSCKIQIAYSQEITKILADFGYLVSWPVPKRNEKHQFLEIEW